MTIKVLIADDHQLFLDGIKSILHSEMDIEIVGEVNNGLQLIQLLEKGLKCSVILMDIRMPIMDGIVTTRVLTKEYPGISVIALSMFNQEADVLEMLEAGAKGYIIKNAGKDELKNAIRTVFQKKNYFSEELPDSIWRHFQDQEPPTERLLTKREKDILRLLAKGRTSYQIAEELFISKFTVDTHRKNVHRKLKISSNAGLIKYTLDNLF
jgi:two-component system nitrate/nitrite response regulator NarL